MQRTFEGKYVYLHGTSRVFFFFFACLMNCSYMYRKPSIDHEPGGTSQLPKTMEEDSIAMKPEDTLGSEKGPLEISSNNDIQEGATKVNTGGKKRFLSDD